MRLFLLGVIVLFAVMGGADAALAAGDGHGTDGYSAKTDLAMWSVVVFVLFVLLLRGTAWGPLIKGLDARESKIREDIADAEASRVKAERVLAEHTEKVEKAQEEIRELMSKAREDAERLKDEILSEARSEAESLRERAVDDVDRARDQALKELFDVVSTQVVGATEHILGRSLSDGDQDRLVSEALAEFAGQSNG